MSSLHATIRVSLAALGTLAGVVACNGVLGITEATLDPSIGTASSETSDAATVDPTSCQAYCNTIDESCSESNAEYTSVPTCLAMCSVFEPGKPGEQTNDSLACRMSHTLRAKASRDAGTSVAADCRHAGPLAAGECVADPCDSFCALAFNLCSPLKLFPYADEAECRTTCTRWPYLTSADAGVEPVGDILLASGNTLNCRLYHLESAYEVGNPNAATTHCRHISDPSSTCR